MSPILTGAGEGSGSPSASNADVIADAPTGVAGTDGPMLATAIGDTPKGGLLLLRSGGSGDTPYALSDALVVSKAMRIAGAGCETLYGSEIATGTPALTYPTTSPYLAGSVLMQTTAGKDALQITASGEAVHLEDFGVRFDDAIKFTNTGTGILSRGTLSSGHYDSGTMGATWRNLSVYGHDGGHYAFDLTNPMQMLYLHLQGFGGGGLAVRCNSVGGNYGNSVFTAPYMVVIAGGAAHAYLLSRVTNVLNLIDFIRPQAWVYDASIGGVTAPTSAQATFYTDDLVNVKECVVMHPDMETNVSSTSTFPLFNCRMWGTSRALFNATNNPLGTSFTAGNPGTVFQNASGTDVLWRGDMKMSPTGAAAATADVYMANNSSMTGSSHLVSVSVPAAGPVDTITSVTWVLPAGFYCRVDAVNATRAWSWASRI